MKNVVITFITSVIMIVVISLSIKHLNNASKDLLSLNEEIQENITDDNWDKAYKSTMELTEKWNNYSKKVKIFINHQEIDSIEMELQKLPQYIKEQTKDESLASTYLLSFLLDHVAELEKIKLENIF